MVDLSKFIFNKKIFSKVIVLSYNQICILTLSLKIYKKKKMKEGLMKSNGGMRNYGGEKQSKKWRKKMYNIVQQ